MSVDRCRSAPVALGIALWLAALAAAAAPPHGLDPAKALTQYGIDVWNTEQGLPSATVNAVLQTRDGHLWLGTYDGLARFDGTRFTVFNRSNTPGLSSNGIRALCEDREGALWIGTNGGGLMRLSGGTFRHYSKADGLPSDIIWSLHLDARDGSLWIGTNGGGLAHHVDGVIQTIAMADAGRVVYGIAQGADGTLWVATQADGLRQRSPDGRWTTYGPREGLPAEPLASVLSDRDGTVWVGTAGGGLRRVAGGRLVPAPPPLDALHQANVSALKQDDAGTLWIGLNGGGLVRYAHGRLSWMTTQDGLPGDILYSLHLDHEGTLWVGTNGGGLVRLRDGTFTPYTTREGLTRDFVYTVFEDRAGTLWAGTSGGLDRMADGLWHPVAPPPGAGPQPVRAITEDAAGDLWIGTYGGGVWRLHAGAWTVYTTRDGLANDNVRAVLADSKGRIWVSTIRGLSLLEGGAWRTYGSASGLPVESLVGLAEDRDGSIWVGTDGAGLCRLRGERFEVFTTRLGLPSLLVLALKVGADGTLWAGSNAGLSRLRGDRFESLTVSTGLPGDAVTQIVEDDQGALWLGTSRGIARVSKEALQRVGSAAPSTIEARVFDRADGLRSTQCTAPGQPAGLRTRDGRVWFATTQGLVTADPRNVRRDAGPPEVRLEEVLVEGHPAPLAGPVVVPPGPARLQFRYSGQPLRAASQLVFQFRLEGFDESWVDAGHERVAEYTGVPHGDFVFRVRARNADGLWSAESASVPLQVQARFWQTRSFALLGLLALAALATGGVRLRTRALETQARELTAQVQERTRRLEQEAAAAVDARHEAERLLGAARALGSAVDLQQVLALILTELQPVVPYDSASVQELRGDQLLIVGGRGIPDLDNLIGQGFSCDDPAHPNGEVLRRRQPIVLEDARRDYPAFGQSGHSAHIQSWLGVPLLFGDRVMGMLSIDSRQLGFYTAEHARVAMAFAAQAANALEHARLFAAARLELQERTLAQVALQHSESRYRDLFEQSLGLICTHDIDGVMISVNSAAAQSLGRRVEEMVGRNLRSFLTPQAMPRFDDYLAAIREQGEATGILGVQTVQGEPRAWRYRNVLRTVGDAQPYVIGFAQDVTDERAAQRAMVESEERFRQLAENLDAVFFLRSVEPARIQYVSPAFEKVWGRPRGPLYEGLESLLETVHPDDRERLQAAMARHVEGYTIEYRILRPDGTTRWVHTRAFPVRGADGEVRRVASIAEDVTESKLVEQLREDLTHTIVHDLKNPLTSIMGSVELLDGALSATLSPEHAQTLHIAHANAQRLLRLVETILDVSRLEAGALPLQRESVALSAVAAEILDLERPLVVRRRLDASIEIPEGLPAIHVDRSLLGRVLQNLVGNAIKFTPPGGRVRVSAAIDGPSLRVQVWDSGPGITPEMRPRLFEKFATGHDGARGSGLGLLFCRLAVEAHGGRIWAADEGDPGATFSFTVPLAAPPAEQMHRLPAESPVRPPGGGYSG